eukprot:CAMPEP_0196810494 /NCGR_PEP_ID=MMETSP1362-20130617/10306_1 /TAXON_ID=163516 /ORGANISM="Leptocylindrus danicus, Strain CCMP1856" /LENGTH=134 /DNA_ID=CAMNT_0042185511 /DNA_START=100 /DNA_END=501 /DNA_ORIENTATION=+
MPRDYEKEKRLLANLDALLGDGTNTDASYTSKNKSQNKNTSENSKQQQPSSFAQQQQQPRKSTSPGVISVTKTSDVEAKKIASSTKKSTTMTTKSPGSGEKKAHPGVTAVPHSDDSSSGFSSPMEAKKIAAVSS